MKRNIKKHSIKILLGVIVGLALLMRLIRLADSPPSMYWDEVSLGYEAFSVAQTGQDTHGHHWLQAFFPAYGDYKAPMYIWLTAVWLKFLPLTVFTTRLTSALAGTMAVLGVYFLGKQLFSTKQTNAISLLAALVMAISPWGLHFSRAAFEANLAMALGLWAMWSLLYARKRPIFALLASVLAATSVYTYVSNRFVLPVIAMTIIAVYFRDFWRQRYWLIIALSLFVVLMIPLARSPYYAISNQYRLSTDSILKNDEQILLAQQLRDAHGNTLLSRLIYHRYWFTGIEALKNFADHVTVDFLFLQGDPNLRHGTGKVGLFYPSMALLFLLGWLVLIRTYPRQAMLLFGGYLVALVPAIIPEETPHALRSLNALPWLVLVIAVGASQLWHLKSRKLIQIFAIVMLSWFVFDLTSYLHYYHFDYPRESQASWSMTYTQMAQYLAQTESENRKAYLMTGNYFYPYVLFYSQFEPKAFIQTQLERKQDGYFDQSTQRFGNYQFVGDVSQLPDKNGLEVAIIPWQKLTTTDLVIQSFPIDSDIPEYAVVEW